MKTTHYALAATLPLLALAPLAAANEDAVVDTEQKKCYSATGEISFPAAGAAFAGQDAQHVGNLMAYVDHGDGTVTDLNTGLMWQKDPGAKMTAAAAAAGAATFNLAGHTDWRLPSIKELYSLIRFDGITGTSAATSVPYIDRDYFVFHYGDTTIGERFIDAQYCSSTDYVGTTMTGDPTVFGVNFADGRIKGYGKVMPDGSQKTFFVQYVRGNPDYGVNHFTDHGDGTISDLATDLEWMQLDSGAFSVGPRGDGTLTWQEALAWADGLVYAGHDDWRLPDAKELQGIVDYTRAPTVTGTAAIDVNFFSITNHESFFWTSTTHLDGPLATHGEWGVYVAFGRAMGWMEMPLGSGNWLFLDVHGAGAQRSDPKDGNPNDPMWSHGHGPQGDEVKIFNYARLVRGGVPRTLAGNAYTLPAATGGTIDFTLDAGPTHAGRTYFLLGSMSGTKPGFTLPSGQVLPLNYDAFTLLTIVSANSPNLSAFLGPLDGTGTATATLDTQGPLDPSLVGTTVTFAYTLLFPFDFVSNAVAVDVEG